MKRAEIERILKALADRTRLRIFEAISARDAMNCGEIISMRGVTPATVSRHLKILSEAGLIACHRRGQFVYSQAVPETIAAYARAQAGLVAPVDVLTYTPEEVSEWSAVPQAFVTTAIREGKVVYERKGRYRAGLAAEGG